MFFQGITTIENLRSEYKRLVFIHHPDKGGDTRTMQDLNNEFAKLLKNLSVTDEQINNYFEEALRNVISELVRFADLTVELCGSWLWVSGSTKEHKEDLKKLGCRFAAKKQMWYFRDESQKMKRSKTLNIDEIRFKYGSKVLNSDGKAIKG